MSIDQMVLSCRKNVIEGNYQESSLLYEKTIQTIRTQLRSQCDSPQYLNKLLIELENEASCTNQILDNMKEALEESTLMHSTKIQESGKWSPPPPLRRKNIPNVRSLSAKRVEKLDISQRPHSGHAKVTSKSNKTNVNNQKQAKQNQNRERTYERPWVQPLPAESSKENVISDYVRHVYGDRGDGPDIELISAIEKDCMETSVDVKFDSIAGLSEAKRLLQEAVVLPLLMPEYFKGIRRPWKGVLMFGPPGTGKTLLAKAVATECSTTFFNVSASTLASKWRGDSEKLVRFLFDIARFYAPSVIFFDEIDSIGSKRGESSEHESSRRVKSELLIQMDGINDNDNKLVMVLAATNRPWDLDEALRRRLEKRIYISLPTEEGRENVFKINLNSIVVDSNVDFNQLARLTENYSCADISNVCREAAMMSLRRKMENFKIGDKIDIDKLKADVDSDDNAISLQDLSDAITNVNRSVSGDDLSYFDKWLAEYGSV